MSGGDGRPEALVVGPLPPPAHGSAVFTELLLDSSGLRARYRLRHLDTSDPRSGENMGRLETENVRLALLHLGRLLRALLRRRPDLLYLPVSQNRWGYLRDGLFVLLGRAARVPVLAHLHGSHFGSFRDGAPAPVRWFVDATTRRLQGAAVLGEGLREIYRRWLPEERIHVVPNGVPDPGVPPGSVLRGEPDAAGAGSGGGLGGEPPIVGYLGALRPSRGILRLVDAFAAAVGASGIGSGPSGGRGVPPGDRSARLVLAGPWRTERYRREVEERIIARGLTDRVHWPGPLRGEEKDRFFRSLDLFVLATDRRGEGQPLVILEAMAHGLPVVATRWGAVPDAVAHGITGIVAPPADTGALARALGGLLADGERRLRMGRAGRRRYEQRFTVGRAMERLADAFDRTREAAA